MGKKYKVINIYDNRYDHERKSFCAGFIVNAKELRVNEKGYINKILNLFLEDFVNKQNNSYSLIKKYKENEAVLINIPSAERFMEDKDNFKIYQVSRIVLHGGSGSEFNLNFYATINDIDIVKSSKSDSMILQHKLAENPYYSQYFPSKLKEICELKNEQLYAIEEYVSVIGLPFDGLRIVTQGSHTLNNALDIISSYFERRMEKLGIDTDMGISIYDYLDYNETYRLKNYIIKKDRSTSPRSYLDLYHLARSRINFANAGMLMKYPVISLLDI